MTFPVYICFEMGLVGKLIESNMEEQRLMHAGYWTSNKCFGILQMLPKRRISLDKSGS